MLTAERHDLAKVCKAQSAKESPVRRAGEYEPENADPAAFPMSLPVDQQCGLARTVRPHYLAVELVLRQTLMERCPLDAFGEQKRNRSGA